MPRGYGSRDDGWAEACQGLSDSSSVEVSAVLRHQRRGQLLAGRGVRRQTGRTDGISAQPLLDTRGDAREFTILDAEGIEFCTRRFGANDTLRELRRFVIKFSAPLPWITPANANFFKYFRFPQVDVSDEHDANADEYLQLHDYRIHLPGSTVSIEDLE
ncbi:hypothetical protein CYMTET_36733 [Cymbomonas tetramitiformis]|uniref:Uncharacterized protein n=1 Tax=Cymbomonas tetramitiformis TaxID=36881 RepID=A0AAE0CGW6_9CHLO|nr:hypothetical protein CYMTET_36733 [Cymbomonas tetramitiformis]